MFLFVDYEGPTSPSPISIPAGCPRSRRLCETWDFPHPKSLPPKSSTQPTPPQTIPLLSVALQMLKQNLARQLHHLADGQRFWQARYYDFNVWTEAKRIEKLRYIHRNPVKRGLVQDPEDWPWSSFCPYVSGVEGVVEIESQWTARKRERMGVTLRLTGPDQNPRRVSAKNGETRTGPPGSKCE